MDSLQCFDPAAHLTPGDVSVDSRENPRIVSVTIKQSKASVPPGHCDSPGTYGQHYLLSGSGLGVSGTLRTSAGLSIPV